MHLDMQDKAAVERRLWEELEHTRFGMLGATHVAGAGFSPMTGFPEPEAGKIWFFTHRDTELAKAAQDGAEATYIAIAKDQAFQTCIRGSLRASFDALHRDKFWNAMVSAWFPKGKDDPSLALLCLICAEADVWVSDVGTLKFGWEIAKANLTGSQPNVGGQAHLLLRAS